MTRLFCSLRGWLSPVFVCILIGRLAQRAIPTNIISPSLLKMANNFYFVGNWLAGTCVCPPRYSKGIVAVS